MRAVLARLIGSDARARVGTVISMCGVLLLGYAVGTYFGLTPGSQVVLPPPPALSHPRPTPTAGPARATLAESPAPRASVTQPTAARQATSSARATPRPAPRATESGERLAPPTAVPTPTVAPTAAPYVYDPDTAGLEDRLALARLARPGPPVLLRIDKIGLETKVVEVGIGKDRRGNPIWLTVPFVAAHYNVTAPVGSNGNAVISGHVVTRYEGNVFRDLYKVDFGDEIDVSTLASTFAYQVTDIKLVPPTQIDVMNPTPDPTLTLITCGGRFDPVTASFDQRLVVVGKLIHS